MSLFGQSFLKLHFFPAHRGQIKLSTFSVREQEERKFNRSPANYQQDHKTLSERCRESSAGRIFRAGWFLSICNSLPRSIYEKYTFREEKKIGQPNPKAYFKRGTSKFYAQACAPMQWHEIGKRWIYLWIWKEPKMACRVHYASLDRATGEELISYINMKILFAGYFASSEPSNAVKMHVLVVQFLNQQQEIRIHTTVFRPNEKSLDGRK